MTTAAWGPRITAAQHTPFVFVPKSVTKDAVKIQCGRRTPRVDR